MAKPNLAFDLYLFLFIESGSYFRAKKNSAKATSNTSERGKLPQSSIFELHTKNKDGPEAVALCLVEDSRGLFYICRLSCSFISGG